MVRRNLRPEVGRGVGPRLVLRVHGDKQQKWKWLAVFVGAVGVESLFLEVL